MCWDIHGYSTHGFGGLPVGIEFPEDDGDDGMAVPGRFSCLFYKAERNYEPRSGL